MQTRKQQHTIASSLHMLRKKANPDFIETFRQCMRMKANRRFHLETATARKQHPTANLQKFIV